MPAKTNANTGRCLLLTKSYIDTPLVSQPTLRQIWKNALGSEILTTSDIPGEIWGYRHAVFLTRLSAYEMEMGPQVLHLWISNGLRSIYGSFVSFGTIFWHIFIVEKPGCILVVWTGLRLKRGFRPPLSITWLIKNILSRERRFNFDAAKIFFKAKDLNIQRFAAWDEKQHMTLYNLIWINLRVERFAQVRGVWFHFPTT